LTLALRMRTTRAGYCDRFRPECKWSFAGGLSLNLLFDKPDVEAGRIAQKFPRHTAAKELTTIDLPRFGAVRLSPRTDNLVEECVGLRVEILVSRVRP
jgi:hypothetical protein